MVALAAYPSCCTSLVLVDLNYCNNEADLTQKVFPTVNGDGFSHYNLIHCILTDDQLKNKQFLAGFMKKAGFEEVHVSTKVLTGGELRTGNLHTFIAPAIKFKSYVLGENYHINMYKSRQGKLASPIEKKRRSGIVNSLNIPGYINTALSKDVQIHHKSVPISVAFVEKIYKMHMPSCTLIYDPDFLARVNEGKPLPELEYETMYVKDYPWLTQEYLRSRLNAWANGDFN